MDPLPIHRLEVACQEDVPDPRGRSALARLRDGLAPAVEEVRTLHVFKIAAALSPAELERVRAEFTDPAIERSAVDRLEGLRFDWAVTVGFRPGVTDNLGRSARVAIADTVGRPAQGDVFTETTWLLSAGGRLTREQAERAARDVLANELIHTLRVASHAEWYAGPPDRTAPRMPDAAPPAVATVDLAVSDEELLRVSRDGLLALSLPEMRAIRDHHARPDVKAARARAGLPPQPTDVELEAFAQTWSEHCKHKIMNAVIRYRDEERAEEETVTSLFRTYIRGLTERLAPELGWLVSVFHDNAGVVRMDDRRYLVYKVETHNSPSALDPYGGAITGIVGVNRDPFGTGRGAALLANVWGYCFASPFHDPAAVPSGLLHPRRVRDGVHQGVIDGGNQSGIPYARGWEYFDERFLGKPLVFCGTVGIMPHRVNGEPSEVKVVRPGHLVVMVGGRIGKDGIHGATFSSAELSEVSPAQAVQIGDPITQKMMTDFLLEARDLGLFTAITDNGAGGLSSSVGEMARATGGADIDLARAPLKYAGLAPWEILLSEAQERMTLAVPPEREAEFLALAARREVEATTLGVFTGDGRFTVRHGGEVVGLLDMEFLHEGCPLMELAAVWRRPRRPPPAPAAHDWNASLTAMLARLNLCSIEEKARQYDHEVKALAVLKPWCGARADAPADATVLLAEPGSREAVILAEGVNPRLSDVDAYAMAAWSVDLAVRRAVAGGARPGRIAGLDNYCWPDPVSSEANPDGDHKCAQLVRATRGLYDACLAFRLPLISGKDSMKNDSVRGGVRISIPPTLLVSVIGWTGDAARCVSMDAKRAGDFLYALGETGAELGGSEYLAWRGEAAAGEAPRFEGAAAAALCEALARAVAEGLVRSAHAPGLGGLAAGLARIAMAGELGLEADFGEAPGASTGGELSHEALLYAETPGRFLVTVAPEDAARFESLLAALPSRRIGAVTAEPRLRIRRGDATLVNAEVAALKSAWKETLSRGELAAGAARPAAPPSAPAARPAAPAARPSPPSSRTVRAVRALVVTGVGFNCEAETAHALRLAGAEPEQVHLSDLLARDRELRRYDILALIGGFAFGDHLGAGTVVANRLRYRLGGDLGAFIGEGRLVMAICNGFQAAVKLGILPGFDGDYETRRVTLAQNDSGVFRDAWVTLRADPRSPCIATRGLELLEAPVRHGEGKLYAHDPAILARIERERLVALRYADPATGEPTREFPHNPNGSLLAAAALTDPTGRIFGVMPHPEAHTSPLHHPLWPRRPRGEPLPAEGAGLQIFRNVVEFAREEAGA